jgi:Fic family protein
MYVYERSGWPEFEWDSGKLEAALAEARNLQGRIVGKMEAMGFNLQAHASLENVVMDVVNSSEIEGEHLDTEEVRSSVARRLGMEYAGMVPSGRHVDGVVDMLLDATWHASEPLTKERLWAWHRSLFSAKGKKIPSISVGKWRDDAVGRMQVISGPFGSERVHFMAPPARYVDFEMSVFLDWFNATQSIDPVLKSGIAHLWFLAIHPFDDGNGRIARAVMDLMLARADGVSQRYYSMSNQIKEDRKGYYSILEQTQKGSLDITLWLEWYIHCFHAAIQTSSGVLFKVFEKNAFWLQVSGKSLNDRQVQMLNLLMDGFQGKLTTSKWALICKCSQDTANRDIHSLMEMGILVKQSAGGRSTSYRLKELPQPTSPFQTFS